MASLPCVMEVNLYRAIIYRDGYQEALWNLTFSQLITTFSQLITSCGALDTLSSADISSVNKSILEHVVAHYNIL